jgi:dihydroorotase
MEALRDAGAVGFTDDGKPLMDAELVKRAMECSASLGMILSFHEEDPAYIKNNGVNHGKASEHFGIYGSDREAEISMIRRDIGLALETGAEIDIQHISTAEGVELVREARKKSFKIHAEATPHHFSLTEEAAIVYGTLAKMNPPLRTERDRQAMIDGLLDGTIDSIATDHAPHTPEEKADFVNAPNGSIGMETSFAASYTVLVAGGLMDESALISKMSCTPAKILGINAGTLKEGAPADMMLFAREDWTVDPEKLHGKSKNTPFKGMTMKARVKLTVCGGRIVYIDQ